MTSDNISIPSPNKRTDDNILIKSYLQSIETRIISNFDTYTQSSERRLAKIEKTLSDLTNNISEMQSKLNDNRLKCLKIDELFQANQKMKDQITSHDNKINKYSKDVHDSLNKFNQILNDHLTIPGLVGNYCKFKSIREYISYNNQQIATLILAKNKVMNEIEKFQRKMIESLGKIPLQQQQQQQYDNRYDKLNSNNSNSNSNSHSLYFNSSMSMSELKGNNGNNNSFDDNVVKDLNEKTSNHIMDKRRYATVMHNGNSHHHNYQQGRSTSIEAKVESRNQMINNYLTYSNGISNGNWNDNQKDNNDDLLVEIRDKKKDIRLIKEHYCNEMIRKTNTKESLLRSQFHSLETIQTKSPLTPQYKPKKKKKKGTKVNKSYTQGNHLNIAEKTNNNDIQVIKDWKKDEANLNELIESKTFITENITISYDKLNASCPSNANVSVNPNPNTTNTIDESNYNNNINTTSTHSNLKIHSRSAKKYKEKRLNTCGNVSFNDHPIEVKDSKTTKGIPYNRAKRNRIQTQMFVGRDKISLLHFEPKKEKLNLCSITKNNINLTKVKSAENLKARLNHKLQKNKQTIANQSNNESKEHKSPNRITFQTNDKLQIDCSTTTNKTHNDDHGSIIKENCLEEGSQ